MIPRSNGTSDYSPYDSMDSTTTGNTYTSADDWSDFISYYDISVFDIDEEIVIHTNFIKRFMLKEQLKEKSPYKTYLKNIYRRNRLIGKREKRIGLKR